MPHAFRKDRLQSEDRGRPKSKYSGVSQDGSGRWESYVYSRRRKIYLGNWDEDDDAARAHDKAMINIFGPENANLNMPLTDYLPQLELIQNTSQEGLVNWLRSDAKKTKRKMSKGSSISNLARDDSIARPQSKRLCAIGSHSAAHSLQDQFQKGNGNFEATDIEIGLTSHSGISHVTNRGFNSGVLDTPPTSLNILNADDCLPQMFCAQDVCKPVADSHRCDTSEMIAEDGRRLETLLAPLTAEDFFFSAFYNCTAESNTSKAAHVSMKTLVAQAANRAQQCCKSVDMNFPSALEAYERSSGSRFGIADALRPSGCSTPTLGGQLQGSEGKCVVIRPVARKTSTAALCRNLYSERQGQSAFNKIGGESPLVLHNNSVLRRPSSSRMNIVENRNRHGDESYKFQLRHLCST